MLKVGLVWHSMGSPEVVAAANGGRKYTVTKITAEVTQGVAMIRITDTITDWIESPTSSNAIREQIDKFIAEGIKTFRVYLNSLGGNCFEATEIANELERFDDGSILVGSVAASAATYLVAKFKTVAKSRSSQFMIHRPRLFTSGDEIAIQADLKLLQNTTKDYKATYAKKMGITEEEVEKMWAKGDLWLTAEEALNMKLIDDIESTPEEIQLNEQEAAVLEASGAPIQPKPAPKQEQENTQIMDKLKIIALLGLSADASDEQIAEALKKTKSNSDLYQADQKTAKDNLEANAKKLVDDAIAAKKITAESRDFFLNAAKADLVGTTAELGRMKPVTKLSAELDNEGNPIDNNAKVAEERKAWDYDKWMDEDPKGLQAMATNQPEQFNKLFRK